MKVSFKKSRLVYLWYFLIAILLFMSIAIVPYSFSLAEQVNSYVPFLVLVFLPILLYYAYQGYAMLIHGDMSFFQWHPLLQRI